TPMAVKKKPAPRKPARAKAASPGGAPSAGVQPAEVQPAAERRSAEALLGTLIARYAPEHMRVVTATRRVLQKRLPTACEIVYEYNGFFVISFSPSKHGHEGVLALRGSADGVKLYLSRGKELPDPAKVLQKAGGETRWIDLESASTLSRPEVVS